VGRVFERMIGYVKRARREVLVNVRPSLVELQTVVAEVKATE